MALYTSLSPAGPYGWGRCSTSLIAAFREHVSVADVSIGPLSAQLSFGWPLEVSDGPMLHSSDNSFMPVRHGAWSTAFNAALSFQEDNIVARQLAPTANRYFDVVFAGSTWGRDVLVDAGVKNVAIALQGVDLEAFCPSPNKQNDRFVVFNSSKPEYRKGTDLVVRALAEFMRIHKDVYFQPVWWNPWEESMRTLCSSSLVKTTPRFLVGDGKGYSQRNFIYALLADNGIPLDRVLPISTPVATDSMPSVINQCDVGLFLSRAEAGIDLGALETMACGVPCVLSRSTGHCELAHGSPLEVEPLRDVLVYRGDLPIARWPEVSWEHAVDALEWAYENRPLLPSLGIKAREHVSRFTWGAMAETILGELRKSGCIFEG